MPRPFSPRSGPRGLSIPGEYLAPYPRDTDLSLASGGHLAPLASRATARVSEVEPGLSRSHVAALSNPPSGISAEGEESRIGSRNIFSGHDYLQPEAPKEAWREVRFKRRARSIESETPSRMVPNSRLSNVNLRFAALPVEEPADELGENRTENIGPKNEIGQTVDAREQSVTRSELKGELHADSEEEVWM